MGQLNSLEERVQAAAVKQLQTAPTTSAVLKVADDKLPNTLTPENKAKATELLSLIGQGKDEDDSGNDVYAQLIPLLGYGTSADVSINDIKADIKDKYLTNAETEMAKAAASGMPDQLLVSQLAPEDLGFTNWGEVAALLKLPPETDLGSLTIQQLTDQVQKVQAEEYSRTSALLRIVNDPNVGAAEKEAARRQLEQLGATGVMAAEADVSNLAAQVDDINTVTIAGKDYTVSELLSDKGVASIVNDYLKNPDRAALIREASPQLATWIDSNKTALENIVGKIDPGFQAVATTIENNAKLQTPATGGERLNDNVMQTLFGQNWKSSTTSLTPPAIYSALSPTNTTVSNQVKLDLTRLLNTMSDRPNDITYLAGLSEAELEEKGLLDPAGIARYSSYIQSSEQLAGALGDGASVSGIVASVFGDKISTSGFNELLEQVRIINDTNLVSDLTPQELEVLKIFDADGDGKMDSISEIHSRAQDMFSGKSLQDLVGGANDIKSGADLLSSLQGKIIAAQSDPTYIKFKDILSDGKIGSDEITQLEQSNASIEDLQLMIDKGVPGSAAVKSLVDKKISSETDSILKNISSNLSNYYRGKQVSDEDVMSGIQLLYKAIDEDTIPATNQAVRDGIKARLNELVDKKLDEISTRKTNEKTSSTAPLKVQLDRVSVKVDTAKAESDAAATAYRAKTTTYGSQSGPRPGVTRDEWLKAKSYADKTLATYNSLNAQKNSISSKITEKEKEVENRYSSTETSLRGYKVQ
jgi:hypothetical protein